MNIRKNLWKYVFLTVVYMLCLSVILTSSLTEGFGSGTVYADVVPYNVEDLAENDQGVTLRAEVNTSYFKIGSSAPHWEIIEITLNPSEINVTIVIVVDYVKNGNDMVPVYSFLYRGKFQYDNPKNTTIYFPLPSGMITDLAVKVNDDLVEKPEIISNNIKLFLAEENSSISVAFNSYGITSYSHEVPKNDFVKDFYFRAVLKKVGSEDISLEGSLSPDNIDTGNSVWLEWDNERTIMRKDIKIELLIRTQEDTSGFISSFLNGLILMGILIGAFYFEGLRCLEHEKKAENYIMLIMPFALLGVVLWALDSLLGLYLGLIFSLMGFTMSHLLIDKKVLRFKKGLSEFFLIPFLFIVLLTGFVIDNAGVGTLLISFSSLSLMVLLALFVRKYPRPPKKEGNRKLHLLTIKKENNVTKEKPERSSIKSASTESKPKKKFCPHCGSSVNNDFGFCPKCGNDISLLERCSKCGVLRKMSDDALFCPNCGNQEIGNQGERGLKKRFSLGRNNEVGFEKTL